MTDLPPLKHARDDRWLDIGAKYIAVEIYDDLIKYDGKVIYTGDVKKQNAGDIIAKYIAHLMGDASTRKDEGLLCTQGDSFRTSPAQLIAQVREQIIKVLEFPLSFNIVELEEVLPKLDQLEQMMKEK